MRTKCPQCQAVIVQRKNRDGPNFCPNCRRLFYVCNERAMPTWVLGILVILFANFQLFAQ